MPSKLTDEQKQLIVESTVNDIVEAANDPNRFKQIDPEAQAILNQIRELCLARGKVALENLLSAEPEPGHDLFTKTLCVDLAAIRTTLEIEEAENFYCGLGGGIDFLRHVLQCGYCQMMLCGTDIPVIDGTLVQSVKDLAELFGLRAKFKRTGRSIEDDAEIPKIQ